MNTEQTWRYNVLGSLFALMAMLITVRMVRIQTNPQAVDLFTKARSYYEGEWHTFYPARGQVFDRWGQLLAGNTMVYEVGVELESLKNPHTVALTLNVVLGLDYASTLQEISQPASANAVYVVLDDNVPQDKIEQLEKFQTNIELSYNDARGKDIPSLDGLIWRAHFQRTYPEKALASNILGFVGRDEDGKIKGYFGIEAKFDDLLAGEPVTVWVPRDPNRVAETPEIPDGASLVLTIDREIQVNMEAILDETLEESGAESGTIVVLDPRSGEVLAMATTPRLDLNRYWDYGEVFKKDTPFNRAVSQAYEPGSVYKVLTMAAALDKGAVKPDTVFLDTGVFEIGGIYIYNWNSGAWGPQDMQGCMQHSLNVCLAWVASQLGARDFYAYMRAFGIGHLTGIDLAGEMPGRLKVPGDADWYDSDLGTNAFGQGVSATPLQMAVAAAALANDGKMMAPRIVRSMVKDGRQYNTSPRLIGMPIKAETARTLSELLTRSLEDEASTALVDGYRIAGKTGTAEIPTPYGYTSNLTNASFVGWGPVDDPRFLVYIWLEKPQSSMWGSEVAAPVFREVVEHLVVLMNIPPDDVRHSLYGQ